MRWALSSIELWLICWFFIVGWEAFMLRAVGNQRSPFNLIEFHHAYLGAALVALGWQFGVGVAIAGIVLTVDDLAQHLVHTYGGDHDYRSPLHQLFAWTLWRIPGVPGVTRFLDAWWGVIAAVAALILIIASTT